MPPKRKAPDDPLEWLNRARSNLARAKADIRLSDVYLEDLCFDAQQAAEKAIKLCYWIFECRFHTDTILRSSSNLFRRQASVSLNRSEMQADYPGLQSLLAIRASRSPSPETTTGKLFG